MPQALLTHFDRDDDLLNVFWRAMHCHSDNEKAEWPGNILSKRTVIYADGTIAREGDQVKFAVDPDELELCRRLAKEAAKVMEEVEFMGGSGECYHEPFYNTAQAGAEAPQRLDAGLIRARFAGTIFAKAEIEVEPMSEAMRSIYCFRLSARASNVAWQVARRALKERSLRTASR